MKKSKIFSVLLVLILLFNISCPSFASAPQEETTAPTEASLPPETEPAAVAPGLQDSATGFDAGRSLKSTGALSLDVKAALLYETGSNTMVYANNIDAKVYPASLTKIMTCLVALERGNLEDILTVSETALSGMDPDGSNVALAVGEKMSMREMLYCVMLASANDACPVVAEHIAGSEAAYLDLMNEKAQQLGCTGTHFANTHGLHDENHYTTARDMLRIFSAALEYPFFRELYATVHHTVPATNLSGERELSTTDLMRNDDSTPEYLDERVEGGKTGFTTPAGRCFVCTATDGDLHYISVILGSQNEILSSGAIYYHNFLDTKSLLDFGFNGFSLVQALSPSAPVGQVDVAMATDKAIVAPKETVTALLPTDYEPRDLKTNISYAAGNLQAPLEAGTQAGSVQLLYKNICVAEAPLVTVNAVTANPIVYKPVKTAQGLAGSLWKIVVMILFVLLIVLLLFLTLVWIRRMAAARRRRAIRRAIRKRRR